MLKILRNLWIIVNIIFCVIVCMLASCVLRLISCFYPPLICYMHYYSGIWGRWMKWILRLNIVVVGLENIRPRDRYVFISNHTSNLDVVVTNSVIPNGLTTIVKRILMWIPFFGQGLWGAHVVGFKRSDSKKAIAAMKKVTAKIKRLPNSLLIFPEGTRSKTGKMEPFKKGGFISAIDAGLPVVPFTIIGANKLYKPGTFWGFDNFQEIVAIIGEPISTAGMTQDDAENLLDRVRVEIQENLDA